MSRMIGKLTAAIGVAGFVLLLPIIIPFAIALDLSHRHRLRKVARSFECTHCGSILGAEALRLADEEWTEYMFEARRQWPGRRPRIVRTLHAICTTCGSRYSFNEAENTFDAEDVESQVTDL